MKCKWALKVASPGLHRRTQEGMGPTVTLGIDRRGWGQEEPGKALLNKERPGHWPSRGQTLNQEVATGEVGSPMTTVSPHGPGWEGGGVEGQRYWVPSTQYNV